MKVLIFGAGNLLLSDEGFGVHAIRYLSAHFRFPPDVELLDAGTMAFLLATRFEESERAYILDIVNAPVESASMLRYEKSDLLLDEFPLNLSPHQIGLQEMLLVSELRGRCPAHITLFGVTPEVVAPGSELSPQLTRALPAVCQMLVGELRSMGLEVTECEARSDVTVHHHTMNSFAPNESLFTCSASH